jgi:hypothetical protein
MVSLKELRVAHLYLSLLVSLRLVCCVSLECCVLLAVLLLLKENLVLIPVYRRINPKLIVSLMFSIKVLALGGHILCVLLVRALGGQGLSPFGMR